MHADLQRCDERIHTKLESALPLPGTRVNTGSLHGNLPSPDGTRQLQLPIHLNP